MRAAASRRLAVVTAVASAAAAAPAGAAVQTVQMPGRFFEPAHVTIVVGDRVLWRNISSERHFVAAIDGSFVSGELHPSAAFARDFTAPGTFGYVCRIHRFMYGRVDVAPVTLTGPAGPVTRGSEVVLSGRAAPASGPVTIESLAPDGSVTPVATVQAGQDGAFSATVAPGSSTTYRASVGAGSSAPVAVDVIDRVRLALSGRWQGRRLILVARASPAPASASLVLELYSRERFAWRRVRRAALPRSGVVRFALHGGVRRRARVVLYVAGATRPVASSHAVAIWLLG